jgi:alpha-1,2-mannosyltransferase
VECFSGYVKFTAELTYAAGCSACIPAFLPSSFAMYFVTLASAFHMEPSSSNNPQRTLLVTVFFAIAAVVGWPFALALSIPFVVEELFLFAGDIVPAADKPKWMISRWQRFARSVAIASLIFVSFIHASTFCSTDLP